MSETGEALLAANGLNLHAVMAIEGLPAAMRAQLAPSGFTQLHLFGHAGPAMWRALQASPQRDAPEPVDSFAAATVGQYFAVLAADYRLLYPAGELQLPLQELGALAGWHHRSPFMVGVNSRLGSWYAYRAVALADTALPVTAREQWGDACAACSDTPCVTACPAAALADEATRLPRCIAFRLEESSPCSHNCLARTTCPVGAEHRYTDAQIRYHYGRSLATIRAWREREQV